MEKVPRKLLARGVYGLFVMLLLSCGENQTHVREGAYPEVNPFDTLRIDRSLRLEGLTGSRVDVVVDAHGIHHIYAENDYDAMVAQGYLCAHDRLFQIELLRRVAGGTLSELVGEIPAVGPVVAAYVAEELDLYYKTIFTSPRGRKLSTEVLEALPERAVEMLAAYCKGINAYLSDLVKGVNGARMPTQFQSVFLPIDPSLIPTYTPETIVDLALFFLWFLCSTVDYELEYAQILHAVGPDVFQKVMQVAPADPTVVLPEFMANYWADPVRRVGTTEDERSRVAAATWIRDVPRPVIDAAQERARRAGGLLSIFGRSSSHSNNWVVGGLYTESGFPFVCNDPHLSMLAPSNFVLVHIDTKTFGRGKLHIAGGAIAGLPGVLLGHNDRVAWAQTAMLYDASDLYVETIVPGRKGGPDTVLFKGSTVPLIEVHDTARLGMKPGSRVKEFTIQVVPHHGPLLPGSRQGDKALSLRWVGYEPEAFTDVIAFLDVLTAGSIDDVFDALNYVRTGSGNWVFADVTGQIGYSGHSLIPVRDNQRIYPPYLPMPGTGEAEWIGFIPEGKLPWARNPHQGFITSSNNDVIGTTLDGDPLNDEYYLYYCRKLGFRARRIEDGLREMSIKGKLTLNDMMVLQADTISLAGARFVPFLLRAFERHPEQVSSDGITEALQRLGSWKFSTPIGVDTPFRRNELHQHEIDESVASSLFHAWLNCCIRNTLADEFGIQPLPGSHGEDGPQFEVKSLLYALEHETNASLFDDLRTTDVVETADDMIVKSLQEAVAILGQRFGTMDMEAWRWGLLHTATFALGLSDIVLPDMISPVLGPFPNDGANFTVDVGNQAGVGDTFFQVHCPQMRFVTEVRPPALETKIVIPCGQSGVRGDRHFDDLMPLWLNNEYVDLPFTPEAVVRAMEYHMVITP